MVSRIPIATLRPLIAVLVAGMLLSGVLGSAQATHDNFCYVVADAGGGPPGNDLLTQVETTNFDPSTNETNIGTGTGTFSIETIAFQPGPGPSTPGPLFAADGGQLGTLNLATGAFAATSSTFGTGNGSLGALTFSDIDGLAFDAASGILFGSHRRAGASNDDVLIQIDPSTGAHIPNAFGLGIDYVVITSFSAVGLADIDDISIDPSDTQMYASANDGGSGDRLVIIDKTSGAVTDVGAFGVADMEGLSFDDNGQLWGTTGVAAPIAQENRLYQINKSTGAAASPRPLDNGTDYESVACHKTLTATATPTPSASPDPISTFTPTTPPTPTPQAGDPIGSELPETGFAPGRVSSLPNPSGDLPYRMFAELRLEIPDLEVEIPIVGIPKEEQGWDVSSLWNQAGYLEGTAFPTWAGNSAITGHVYLADGTPGPFAQLATLLWGDEIIIQAFGLRHVYEVRQVKHVLPSDFSVLQHEDHDWITLITCREYNAQLDTYLQRTVVRAVLMEVRRP